MGNNKITNDLRAQIASTKGSLDNFRVANLKNSAMNTFAGTATQPPLRRLTMPENFPANERERHAAEAMEKALHGLDPEVQRKILNELAHGALDFMAYDGIVDTSDVAGDLRVLSGFRPDQQQRIAAAYKGTGHMPHELVAMSQERLKQIEARRPEIAREKAELADEILQLDKDDEIHNTLHGLYENPQLQRLGESGFHKLMEAYSDKDVMVPSVGNVPEYLAKTMQEVGKASATIFVVQHDWAAALKNATDFEGGEWMMPGEHTVFEFRISGRRVILMCGTEGESDSKLSFVSLHVETKSGRWLLACAYDVNSDGAWVPLDTVTKVSPDSANVCKPVMELCRAQVRAISISLEAKVAETEIIRAPHKLNQARERKGKPPIWDYHVVNLAHRKRYAPRAPEPGDIAEDEKHHRRLHWVRGHTRYYPNHKVWIKWHLRGDPDLGFIDKEYRL